MLFDSQLTRRKKLRAHCRKVVIPLLLMFTISCREQVVHDLTEAEANKILTLLDQAQIDAEKIRQADNHWSLAVEGRDTLEAINILNNARMFQSEKPSAPRASSLISSREDQRFQYERSLSHEIERTLQSVPGVLEAHLHLSLPTADPLFGRPLGQSDLGSASALLITDDHFQVEPQQIGILISGASGIPPEKISVLVNRVSGTLTGRAEASVSGPMSSGEASWLEVLPFEKGKLFAAALGLITIGAFLLGSLGVALRRGGSLILRRSVS